MRSTSLRFSFVLSYLTERKSSLTGLRPSRCSKAPHAPQFIYHLSSVICHLSSDSDSDSDIVAFVHCVSLREMRCISNRTCASTRPHVHASTPQSTQRVNAPRQVPGTVGTINRQRDGRSTAAAPQAHRPAGCCHARASTPRRDARG